MNLIRKFGLLAVATLLIITTFAHTAQSGTNDIYRGYFDNSQIKSRTLADWEGDWQSAYPYLLDGTLDVVMKHKAKTGEKTFEEYRDYYATGYRTKVNRILIEGKSVTFHRSDSALRATYESDGYEILTYEKGNRGVRYVYRKSAGDGDAPQFIQFSDHHIAPEKVGHFHLYWGNDRTQILNELTNWPTYYPAGKTGEQIVAEMLAH